MVHSPRDYESNPVVAQLFIPGLCDCKIGRFLDWRDVLVDMTGGRITHVLRDRRSVPLRFDPFVIEPDTLGLFEAELTDPAWGVPVTPERRRGVWAETPEEPLWVLLYLTVPGGTLFARHAAAIADRLDELDELVHFVAHGRHTAQHEYARAFFHNQAISGEDVTSQGMFETLGWIDFDLAAVDPG